MVPTWTTIAENGVNAFPIISTVEPTGPVVGINVIVGGVTLKFEVAVFPVVSVTTTVLFETAVNGTAKFVETLPPDPVVPAPAVIKAPLRVTLNAVPAVAKPVPVTKTNVPLSMPVVGEIDIDGTTVNVVNALLTPSPNSTVYGPPGIDGTINHVVRLKAFAPVVGTVVEPKVLGPCASKLVLPRVAVFTPVMPTTITVTFVPTIADATEVVTVGAPSMVKVATALSVGNETVRFTVYTPATREGTLNPIVPGVIPPEAFTGIEETV